VTRTPRIWLSLIAVVAVVAVSLSAAGSAAAGDYYVYSCSTYGNTAPAFSGYSNAAHLVTAGACMQPAPHGGYRSLEINNNTNPVANGYGAEWLAIPPSGISVVGAYTPVNAVIVDGNFSSDGWSGSYTWTGGSQTINCVTGCGSGGLGYADGINTSFAPSPYFGWGVSCTGSSSCSSLSSSGGDVLGVQGVRLTAEENTGPSVVAVGSNNLWYQSAHWVRGGGWPVTFTASDPSGICGTHMVVDGAASGFDNYADYVPDTSRFTQCPASEQPTGTFDTTAYPNGSLGISYQASNAAGVASAPAETLQVDNTPVSLSLSTPNDSDPNGWVNHAVSVLASPSAGPSGVGGTSCSTNNGTAYSYPSGGVPVDGTGVWTVSCTSANNAYDVTGHVASSPTQSVSVHIDETPPAVALEAVNPSDPEAVVADTSDGQSGVSGGQVAMRPANGTTWQNLPTSFDGSHLIARFDDATLARGPWVIQATSCDAAGNCASTEETLTLPVRLASASYVGFGKIVNPLKVKKIRKRVLVGWHWKTVGRHGHKVRMKVGGHHKTITVIKRVEKCTHKRVKVGKHRWRVTTACHPPRIKLLRTKRVGFGRAVTIGGIAATTQGIPLANQPVEILTAPDNGLGEWTLAASVTTNANGGWQAGLRPGPSRLIRAVYPGSPTVLPATGRATLNVPSRIVVSIGPRRLPWSSTLTIRGHLAGGYIPSDGVALRLLVRYPGSRRASSLLALRTNARGAFEIHWSYNGGRGVASYPFWVATTATETDYPFAAGGSRHAVVTFGVPTPHPRASHHHKHKHHKPKRRRRK
jgi:hypothetical protein